MKSFKFNLEKVLKLRHFKEQEAKNELGEAIGILVGIENKIKQNDLMRKKAAQERFTDINKQGANLMTDWENYIMRLEHEKERLTVEAEAAEKTVEEKRGLYIEASRELKIMEKLKEKQKLEYRKEAFSAQTKEMDDLFKADRLNSSF